MSAYLVQEGTPHGYEYQEIRIFESHFGGWILHHFLKYLKYARLFKKYEEYDIDLVNQILQRRLKQRASQENVWRKYNPLNWKCFLALINAYILCL